MVARTDVEFGGDGCPNGTTPSGGGGGGGLGLPPQTALQTVAGVSIRRNTCPFMHGSVGAGPFPGYVHGTHPEICKNGCRPAPDLGKYGYKDETPLQTLVREALEYQDLFHKDMDSPAGAKEARVAEILAEIEATGTYELTFAELQHGARCAWRNAPKCSNRKFWEELQLVDGRSCTTPAEMFECCLEVLERATLSCVTTANIAVFRAQTPGTQDGPRVWNNQLIRYAGFRQPDGSIIGDPAEADFTEMCQQLWGWEPPEGSDPRFTILPVLLQAHPDEQPQLFTLPEQYVVTVPIRHPDIEAITALGLQWYAVPAVSCLELSVGGLTFTGIPFNGWYADTEIVRNITDEGRLDMCRAVARCLGLDTKSEASLWRDRAIVEVDVAVLHSFREAGMGMADHTTLMQQFYKWYNRELLRRGYSPGNWKWIITPVSPTATKCYLHLNHMTEYTIKPGYWYGPGWKGLKARWECDHPDQPLGSAAGVTPRLAAADHPTLPTAVADAGAVLPHPLPTAALPRVALLYASVTGTTEAYAQAVAAVMRGALAVSVHNMEEFESEAWADIIASSRAVLVLTSTYGPGAPPGTAAKFVAWLQGAGEEVREAFTAKAVSVLGFGSSCYPRFCAAADLVHALLLSAGARPLLPVAKADALAGEEMAVWSWVKRFSVVAAEQGWMDAHAQDSLVQRLPMSDGSKPPPFVPAFTLVRIAGEGLKAARERRCHWATVLEATELLPGPKDGASTKLVRLDMGMGGKGAYYAGDEIQIFGENPRELVDRFASQLGIEDLDEMFLLQSVVEGEDGEEDAVLGAGDKFPLPNTFRTILTRHAGLSEGIGFGAVAALAGCAPEDAQLQRLGSDYQAYQAWVSATMPCWGELFTLFPSLIVRVPLAMFFQLVPALKPRYYSISSSSAVTPSEVAVTVGLLTYKLPSGASRHGFCSRYITQLQPGDRVRFKLTSQPAFRQPLNLEAPVVMVAAGTGLAPFRGFWEERALRLRQGQKLGPAVLVFGCRSRDSDFLYADALAEMIEGGSITQLLPALSREPGVRKAYVQDVVARSGELLAPLLTHPRCHVYICGSSNMAQEVGVALAKVAGKEVMDKMVVDGRFHEDVFGVSVGNHAAAARAAQEQVAVKVLASAGLEAVVAQLEGGLAVDCADETASTLLHHAAHNGRADLAAALIACKAAVNVVNKFGLTPLAEAEAAGHDDVAAALREAGGARSSKLHSSFYTLHAAVMEEDAAVVAKLLEEGSDPNQTDYFQTAPLHIAAALGSVALAETLLDSEATNPNAQNALGMTPLQLAVARNQPQVANLLRSRVGGIRPAHITSGAVQGSADPNSGSSQLQGFGVSPEDLALVRASWAFVAGEAKPAGSEEAIEEFGRSLFLALFDLYPSTLDFFPFKGPDGMPVDAELRKHGKTVALSIGEVIHLLERPQTLTRYLTDIIERHYKYGVELVHYDVVLGAIALFVESLLPARFVPEEKAAWSRVLGVIKVVATGCYAARDAARDAAQAEDGQAAQG